MTDLRELAERVAAADGVAPLNEASLLALDAVEAARVDERVEADGLLVAAAYAPGDAPVEVFVDPARRREGFGTRLAAALAERGERRFWAHGDLPGAQALAARLGLRAVRTLLVLRREDASPAEERTLAGVTIRTFRPDDVDAILAVNARAFADHPEQGAMDRADFERRAASDWFDPEGLFVAERDGEVVGFHWTKVEGDVGEVYVVGVDPAEHGRGLGTALTAHGLRHLDERVPVVDLYVEADNAPALAVYQRLGFTEHARDTLYEAAR
ncbi:MAG: mycothiol synthase [Aeromicrobium sp.]|uniref:mycothiol synthase n=1 Tax=Aeromicrobium sp. TaxID=1871063 RepID=UPI0039E2FB92